MNLVEHAIRELELCGQAAESPAYAQSLVSAVKAFTEFGHNGASAGIALHQLHALLLGEALSPLTSDPDEWEDRTDSSNTPLWQNRRDSRAFSNDGGKTWWYVSPRHPGERTKRNSVATVCTGCGGRGIVTQPISDMVHDGTDPRLPHRDDATAGWLKRTRDSYDFDTRAWHVLDWALGDYHEHADTGTPLAEDVQGPEHGG